MSAMAEPERSGEASQENSSTVKPFKLLINLDEKQKGYSCLECGDLISSPHHQSLYLCCDHMTLCGHSLLLHFNRKHNLQVLKSRAKVACLKQRMNSSLLICGCGNFSSENGEIMARHVANCRAGNQSCEIIHINKLSSSTLAGEDPDSVVKIEPTSSSIPPDSDSVLNPLSKPDSSLSSFVTKCPTISTLINKALYQSSDILPSQSSGVTELTTSQPVSEDLTIARRIQLKQEQVTESITDSNSQLLTATLGHDENDTCVRIKQEPMDTSEAYPNLYHSSDGLPSRLSGVPEVSTLQPGVEHVPSVQGLDNTSSNKQFMQQSKKCVVDYNIGENNTCVKIKEELMDTFADQETNNVELDPPMVTHINNDMSLFFSSNILPSISPVVTGVSEHVPTGQRFAGGTQIKSEPETEENVTLPNIDFMTTNQGIKEEPRERILIGSTTNEQEMNYDLPPVKENESYSFTEYLKYCIQLNQQNTSMNSDSPMSGVLNPASTPVTKGPQSVIRPELEFKDGKYKFTLRMTTQDQASALQERRVNVSTSSTGQQNISNSKNIKILPKPSVTSSATNTAVSISTCAGSSEVKTPNQYIPFHAIPTRAPVSEKVKQTLEEDTGNSATFNPVILDVFGSNDGSRPILPKLPVTTSSSRGPLADAENLLTTGQGQILINNIVGQGQLSEAQNKTIRSQGQIFQPNILNVQSQGRMSQAKNMSITSQGQMSQTNGLLTKSQGQSLQPNSLDVQGQVQMSKAGILSTKGKEKDQKPKILIASNQRSLPQTENSLTQSIGQILQPNIKFVHGQGKILQEGNLSTTGQDQSLKPKILHVFVSDPRTVPQIGNFSAISQGQTLPNLLGKQSQGQMYLVRNLSTAGQGQDLKPKILVVSSSKSLSQTENSGQSLINKLGLESQGQLSQTGNLTTTGQGQLSQAGNLSTTGQGQLSQAGNLSTSGQGHLLQEGKLSNNGRTCIIDVKMSSKDHEYEPPRKKRKTKNLYLYNGQTIFPGNAIYDHINKNRNIMYPQKFKPRNKASNKSTISRELYDELVANIIPIVEEGKSVSHISLPHMIWIEPHSLLCSSNFQIWNCLFSKARRKFRWPYLSDILATDLKDNGYILRPFDHPIYKSFLEPKKMPRVHKDMKEEVMCCHCFRKFEMEWELKVHEMYVHNRSIPQRIAVGKLKVKPGDVIWDYDNLKEANLLNYEHHKDKMIEFVVPLGADGKLQCRFCRKSFWHSSYLRDHIAYSHMLKQYASYHRFSFNTQDVIYFDKISDAIFPLTLRQTGDKSIQEDKIMCLYEPCSRIELINKKTMINLHPCKRVIILFFENNRVLLNKVYSVDWKCALCNTFLRGAQLYEKLERHECLPDADVLFICPIDYTLPLSLFLVKPVDELKTSLVNDSLDYRSLNTSSEIRLQCQKCNMILPLSNYYQHTCVHKSVHIGKRFQCPARSCHTNFATHHAWLKHVSHSHGDVFQPLEETKISSLAEYNRLTFIYCPFCYRGVHDTIHLKRHIQNFHPMYLDSVTPCICKCCSFYCYDPLELADHMIDKHRLQFSATGQNAPNRIQPEPEIEVKKQKKKCLKSVQQIEKKEKAQSKSLILNITCPYCSNAFQNAVSLQNHMDSKHQGHGKKTFLFECPLTHCKVVFQNIYDLENHMIKCHYNKIFLESQNIQIESSQNRLENCANGKQQATNEHLSSKDTYRDGKLQVTHEDLSSANTKITKEHLSVMDKEEVFGCYLCLTKLSQYSEVFPHMILYHTSDPRSCRFCEDIFCGKIKHSCDGIFEKKYISRQNFKAKKIIIPVYGQPSNKGEKLGQDKLIVPITLCTDCKESCRNAQELYLHSLLRHSTGLRSCRFCENVYCDGMYHACKLDWERKYLFRKCYRLHHEVIPPDSDPCFSVNRTWNKTSSNEKLGSQQRDAEDMVFEKQIGSKLISTQCLLCNVNCSNLKTHLLVTHSRDPTICWQCGLLYARYQGHICDKSTDKTVNTKEQSTIDTVKSKEHNNDDTGKTEELNNDDTEKTKQQSTDDAGKILQQSIDNTGKPKQPLSNIKCPLHECRRYKFSDNYSYIGHIWSLHQEIAQCCRFCEVVFIGQHSCSEKEKIPQRKASIGSNGTDQKCLHCLICKHLCNDSTVLKTCGKEDCIYCRNFSQCKGLVCSTCSFIFHDEHTHRRHAKTHGFNILDKIQNTSTESRPKISIVQCSICNASLKECYLFRHMMKKHKTNNSDQTHFCEECGKSFKCRFHLNQHRTGHLRKRGLDQKIKCPKCSKHIYKGQCFDNHMKNVHGKKRYMCHICGKQYYYKFYLTWHMKFTHGNQRPKAYNCDKCKYKCSRKQQLVKHMLQHS